MKIFEIADTDINFFEKSWTRVDQPRTRVDKPPTRTSVFENAVTDAVTDMKTFEIADTEMGFKKKRGHG